MKFKGVDFDGNFFEGIINDFSLRICTADGKKQIIDMRIKRRIEDDINGNDVYEGDIIITPKHHVFTWFLATYETHGEEFRVPYLVEPFVKFMQSALMDLIRHSTLKVPS